MKAGTDTEIRELKRGAEDNVTSIHDRFGPGAGGAIGAELVRSAERMNRTSVRRIVEDEAARCFPALQRATSTAQWARQLKVMAEFAGDAETAKALGKALDEVSAAA